MVESGNFQEQYASMTPKERNAELHAIYDMFPQLDLNEELNKSGGEAWGHVLKIENSEMKNSLRKKLPSLLAFAAITNSFKDKIVVYFERDFEFSRATTTIATEKGNETFSPIKRSRDSFEFILDKNNPDSSGVFDLLRAMEIEREVYREELRVACEVSGVDEISLLADPDEELSVWRNEFIERNGEEP